MIKGNPIYIICNRLNVTNMKKYDECDTQI
jgi:hypothetical protein